jgi:hypothetical protein
VENAEPVVRALLLGGQGCASARTLLRFKDKFEDETKTEKRRREPVARQPRPQPRPQLQHQNLEDHHGIERLAAVVALPFLGRRRIMALFT